MTRDRWIQVVSVFLILACLAGGSALSPGINDQRKDLQLTSEITRGDAVAPHIALLTQALGSLRGLLVDIMWYRANQLKEDGQFQEANQLSEWITDLQPRYPQVWSFHAWNMAYNISVATHTKEERWDWVSKGINLLRDKGIPNNPNSVRLYRELSWIFFHKIGQNSDDMHWYYKRRLAYEWEELLGNQTEGFTTQQVIDNFCQIADAPTSLDQLVEKSPQVKPLLAALARIDQKPDEEFVRRVGRVLMLNYSGDVMFFDPQSVHLPPGVDPRLLDVMRAPAMGPAFGPLVAYLRNKALRETYHMDPQYMLKLMEMFGPMDWRHPASHSAYWASLGVNLGRDLRNKKDIDMLNTHRSSIHSLQSLTFGGKLSYDVITDQLDMSPDPRFIPAYEKAFEASPEILEPFGKGTTENYEAGHENFLLTAVVFSYLYGEDKQAEEYYKKLRDKYGMKEHNVRTGRYLQPLADLVLSEMKDNGDLNYNTSQFIDAMLIRAFVEGMANNRPDVFAKFMQLAQASHKQYQAKSIANPNAPQDRMVMLPFEVLVADRYQNLMLAADRFPLLTRARVWRNTPDGLKQVVYDRIRDSVTAQALRENMDPQRMFPEPPGMDEFRKAHPRSMPTTQPTATQPTDQPTLQRAY